MKKVPAKAAKKVAEKVATKKGPRVSQVEKVSEAGYKAMAAAIQKGKLPETIGEHFRARIVQGKLSNEDILKEVKAKHKGCAATMSSLYWNRQYLAHHDGITLPERVAAAE